MVAGKAAGKNKSILVSTIGLSHRAVNALRMFFRGPCTNNYTLADDTDADVSIIDMDAYDAKQTWKNYCIKYPDRLTIIESINDPTIDLNTNRIVFLRKPVNGTVLKNALNEFRLQLQSQAHTKKRPLPLQQMQQQTQQKSEHRTLINNTPENNLSQNETSLPQKEINFSQKKIKTPPPLKHKKEKTEPAAIPVFSTPARQVPATSIPAATTISLVETIRQIDNGNLAIKNVTQINIRENVQQKIGRAIKKHGIEKNGKPKVQNENSANNVSSPEKSTYGDSLKEINSAATSNAIILSLVKETGILKQKNAALAAATAKSSTTADALSTKALVEPLIAPLAVPSITIRSTKSTKSIKPETNRVIPDSVKPGIVYDDATKQYKVRIKAKPTFSKPMFATSALGKPVSGTPEPTDSEDVNTANETINTSTDAADTEIATLVPIIGGGFNLDSLNLDSLNLDNNEPGQPNDSVVPTAVIKLSIEDAVKKLELEEQNASSDSTSSSSNSPEDDKSFIEDKDGIYYNPGHYLQGFIKVAFKQAQLNRKNVLVQGLSQSITILYQSRQVFLKSDTESSLAVSERSLIALSSVPIAKNNIKISILSDSYDEICSEEGLVFDYDPFMWKLATRASRGRIPTGTDLSRQMYLGQMPNIPNQKLSANALKISALWAEEPSTLSMTAQTLDIPQRDVFLFLSAAWALDLLKFSNLYIEPEFRIGGMDNQQKRQALDKVGLFQKMIKTVRSIPGLRGNSDYQL